jgi:hypothetical protein
MAFLQSCFIRKNTPELRTKLKELGYHICSCAEFEDSIWLRTSFITNEPTVHGIGFIDEDYTGRKTTQEELDFFLYENSKSKNPRIDCGDNEEIFLALAALRDATNEHQWFIATDTLWDENYNGEITTYFEKGQWFKYDEWSYIEDMPSYFRKATVEEIIEHFNKN